MNASKVFVLACALITNLAFGQSSPCIGKVVLKEGAYGAINSDVFQQLQSARRDDDQARIKALVSDGVVIALPARAVACVNSVQFHQYSRTLSVPGVKVAVIVSDDFSSGVETE